MARRHVLIIDDSVVVRRLVAAVLESDPDFVVTAASSAAIGLARIAQSPPDIVLLDVEMPDMGGLEALAVIRASHPRLPVIMFSSLTARGAAVTLEALARGATDYLAKPTSVGRTVDPEQYLRQMLVPLLRSVRLSNAPMPLPTRVAPAAAPAQPATYPVPKTFGQPIDVIAIGSSTGGPNALTEIIPALPGDLPVPIVIVQHMPPDFTRHLASRLNDRAKLRVREAAHGDVLEPGLVLLAPGDFHIEVVRQGAVRIAVHQGPPENSCRPAVDVLLRSVAHVYGAKALALILTGMGQDGMKGAEVLAGCGGQVWAQDEASSVVWGMPGSVAKAGIADKLLDLSQIAGELEFIAQRRRVTR